MTNARGMPEIAEKGLRAIIAESWLLHEVVRLQVNHFISLRCCIMPKTVFQIKFDRQMVTLQTDCLLEYHRILNFENISVKKKMLIPKRMP